MNGTMVESSRLRTPSSQRGEHVRTNLLIENDIVLLFNWISFKKPKWYFAFARTTTTVTHFFFSMKISENVSMGCMLRHLQHQTELCPQYWKWLSFVRDENDLQQKRLRMMIWLSVNFITRIPLSYKFHQWNYNNQGNAKYLRRNTETFIYIYEKNH